MKPNRRLTILAVAYSAVLLAGGATVSLVTGDWLALVCATGLVVFPLGAVGARRRSASAA
jgi:hypothetical protein